VSDLNPEALDALRIKPDYEGFSRAMLTEWPTGDIDGAYLFECALQYGMIREVPGGYDPDNHMDTDGICPEPGDPWYEYTFGGKDGPGLFSLAEMRSEITALRAQLATPSAPSPEAVARAALAEFPSDDDREWIDNRADQLFRESERRRGGVRPATTTPQDFRDYFVVSATAERLAAIVAKAGGEE
jgi:hypothetical protein